MKLLTYILGFLLVGIGVLLFRKERNVTQILNSLKRTNNTYVIVGAILQMIFGFMVIIPDYQTIGLYGSGILQTILFIVLFYIYSKKKSNQKKSNPYKIAPLLLLLSVIALIGTLTVILT